MAEWEGYWKPGDRVEIVGGPYRGIKAILYDRAVSPGEWVIQFGETGPTDVVSGFDLRRAGEIRRSEPPATPETVNHPSHYNGHPSGVECITIAEHFGFNLGNAIKYIWRAGLKGDSIEDLRKAAFYLNREISNREKAVKP